MIKVVRTIPIIRNTRKRRQERSERTYRKKIKKSEVKGRKRTKHHRASILKKLFFDQ